MRLSTVILVFVSTLCGHAGQIISLRAFAAEPSAGLFSGDLAISPPARLQGTNAPERIRIGDMVVVVAAEAEVTWAGNVIARIPRGGTFRVLQVGQEAVAGWIKILNRQDIEWTKRGHEIGWVRLDQVALARPGEIDPAAPPVARATPPDLPVAPPVPPAAPSVLPAAPPVLPVTPLPQAVPPAVAPERTPGVESSGPGHFSCRTFVGPERDLCAAVSENQRDQVQKLLASGVNINARSRGPLTNGMTMLMLAVWYRWDHDIVQLLIDSGANVNARDDRGNTALSYVAEARPTIDLAVTEMLLKAGADANARGEGGMTALMHAAMHDDRRVVSRLIEARADVRASDAKGWTALMHATRRDRGYPAIIALLIEAGADVNAAHLYGGTALSSACYNGHRKAVELLLTAGADVNARDQSGWTPLICACINGQTPIVELLRRAGAAVNAEEKAGCNCYRRPIGVPPWCVQAGQ